MANTLSNEKDPGKVLTIISNIHLKIDDTETHIKSLEDSLTVFIKNDSSEDSCMGSCLDAVKTSPLLQHLEALYNRIETLNAKLVKLESRIDV